MYCQVKDNDIADPLELHPALYEDAGTDNRQTCPLQENWVSDILQNSW